MTSLTTSCPAGTVAWIAWPKVTFRVVPRTAVPPLSWTAMSTAPTVSGSGLYRLDSVMRTAEPATLLWATIRMVWSVKDGPPVVMLGDQALTRVPFAPAAAVVLVVAPEAWTALIGATVMARPASATAKYLRVLLRRR